MSDSNGKEALRRWIGGEDNVVIYDWLILSDEKEEEVERVRVGDVDKNQGVTWKWSWHVNFLLVDFWV